jgi:hypothetical protein
VCTARPAVARHAILDGEFDVFGQLTRVSRRPSHDERDSA